MSSNNIFPSFFLLLFFLSLINHFYPSGIPAVEGYIKVNPSNLQFIDELNRTKIFHGVNAVYKIAPFYPRTDSFHPNTSLTDIDLKNLRNWGFNIIRLYIAWEGTEPQRGVYNTNYLLNLQKIVQNCQKYGIHVILDAHQDVMSNKFCGEGFPDWAVHYDTEDFPYPFLNYHFRKNETTGAPLTEDCLKHAFFQYYLTRSASNAWQNFYDNYNGIRDAFANFWNFVANYFKSEENILGYEIINEPWAGDFYKDITLLLDQTGKADRVNLMPLYKQVNSAIRKADKNHIILFEPTVSDLLSAGFESSPLGSEDLDKQVFSYHVYCGDVNKTGDPQSRIICSIGDDISFVEKERTVKKLKVGGFLTEFGALSNFSSSGKELNWITGIADDYLRSWTYWQFKYYEDITTAAMPPTIESFYGVDGQLQTLKVKSLSRTYAQSVCGDIIRMKFDPESANFHLQFRVNSICQNQPTVIYLNQDYYYSNGFNVKVNPSKSLKAEQKEKNYLQFTIQPGTVKVGDSIDILITSE
ncbi:hypothetical protein ABK040_009581 [Willaertia magna]